MDINHVLHHKFNIAALRPNQEAVVNAILKHQNILALLATGAGKSLTFQLPLYAQGKKAIVISPLIALMEDQVMELKMRRINACCIHSYLSFQDKSYVLNNIQQYDFIYCSPEWLFTSGQILLDQFDCEAIVIDEAHCISEWGYDFRPHYLRLHEIINFYDAQVIALTATANDKVIYDIQHVLRTNLKVIDHLYIRDNIYLSVVHTEDDVHKYEQIKQILQFGGPTVIYFSSKKQVDYIYEQLLNEHFRVERYHADMTYEDRMNVQQRFMNDEIQIICATNAFGMGVNKSNIRTVIHYHMPKSIFQYIQEIGRSGRDGKQSQAILLYSQYDEMIAERLLSSNFIDEEEIDMFIQGITLPEEKHELLDTLFKYYQLNEVKHKIIVNQSFKQNALNQMLSYINTDICLNQKLINMKIAKQNNTKEGKAEKHLLCCEHCNNQKFIKFEKVNFKVHKKIKQTLLNQLFNGLYDFT